jgi:general stress protein 26
MVKLSDKEKEFMKKKYFASFAVVSPKTKLPFNTTVWLYYHETTEKFYVITNKETAKWRFLKNGDQKVGINVHNPIGWPYISINGKVKIYSQDDREDFWDIVTEIIKKYNSEDEVDNWRQKMENTGNRFLLELEPENIYSTVK